MNIQESINNKSLSSDLLWLLLKEPIILREDNPYTSLKSVLFIMDTICKIGYIEHTNDWDAWGEITLKTGTVIGIPPGYGDCLRINYDCEPEYEWEFDGDFYSPEDTKGFTLCLDSDELDIKINIWDIKSIKLGFDH